jgi:hypothetical protein
MRPHTTMTIYRDIVLECQHCYMICRFADAAIRRTCPSCGRDIAAWEALVEAVRKQGEPSPAQ